MDVSLHLTHQCNLRCIYCYGGRKFARSMPGDVMRKGVEMAFLGHNAKVAFFGGEPLLEYPMIRRAVSYARKIEAEKKTIPLRFSLTVNGTLLDEEKLDFMAEEGMQLVVSLDGSRDSHEATRPLGNGASSYDIVREKLQLALQKLPNTEVLSVIDPRNVHLLAESFDSLWSLGVRCFHLNTNYAADWSEEELEQLQEGFYAIADRYVEHYRAGFGFSIDVIDAKIISHLKGGYSCRDRCKFGDGEIAVAPSGRLYPCERLIGEDKNLEVSIGNVVDGVDLHKVLALKKRTNEPDEECRECEFAERCTFWCGCVNYATTGDVGQTSGVLCLVEQARIRAADRAAKILFDEQNPLFIQKFYSAV